MAHVQAGVAGSVDTQEAAARKLLESDGLARAIELLESYDDSSGVREAVLGAAYFRKEDYPRAADYLLTAQARGQSSSELQGLLTRAVANTAADVQRPVPAPSEFSREQLL